MNRKVRIIEVGPRDGFQMENAFIPTDFKAAVIEALSDAGISKIEATSFVHPSVIPQLRDASDLMRRLHRIPGLIYSCLVPNVFGAKAALDAGADSVRVVVCMTESYNQRNTRMSIAQSGQVCEKVLRLAHSRAEVEVVLGVAFGCPLEGSVPEERVVGFVEYLAKVGIREISLADSVGLANPPQVRRMVRRIMRHFPEVHLSLHIHNTRGLGLVNVMAGLEEGIDSFDSSFGGLGGCPVVPGATGNVATEDLLYLLHEQGVETGVDLDAVMAVSRRVSEFLRRPLASYVLSAGTREQLFRRIAASAAVESSN